MTRYMHKLGLLMMIAVLSVYMVNALPITNCTELQNIPASSSNNYTLSNDIDCSDTINWNAGAGFVPISNYTGVFEGNGYTIDGLFINRPSTDDVGLFADLNNDADIQNLTMTNSNITGNNNVGTIVGYSNKGGQLWSVNVLDGIVTGQGDAVGGFIGLCDECDAYDNRFEGSVTGHDYVGGLIGNIYAHLGSGTIAIYRSYVDANITGNLNVGGIVGKSTSNIDCVNNKCTTYIRYSEVHGLVQGNTSNISTYVGGIIGYSFQYALNMNSQVYYSTVYATVKGGNRVGGIAGQCYGGTTYRTAITQAVMYGNVDVNTTYTQVGTLVGYQGVNRCTLSQSRYDIDMMTSGLNRSTNGGTCTNCAGNTTINLMNTDGYPTSWNFSLIWNIHNDSNFGSSYAWLRDLEPLSTRDAIYTILNVTSPANETKTNESMVIHFSAKSSQESSFPCYLYIDGSLNMTQASYSNNTASTFSPTLTEGFHSWEVVCDGGIWNDSSGSYIYYYDVTQPVINSVYPNIFNTTTYGNFVMNFTGNVTNLNLTNVTRIIRYPNGTEFYHNETTTFADASVHTWNESFNTTLLPQGIWSYYIHSEDLASNTKEAFISFTVANCMPNWVCTGYASCNISDLAPCNSVNDTNNCGYAFGFLGESYSDFSPQACNYCSYNLNLDSYGSCDTIAGYRIDNYTDLNFASCCNVTQLASDCYFGVNDSQGSVNVSCNSNYIPEYESDDVNKVLIDGLFAFGFAMMGLAGVMALILLFKWGKRQIKKGDKR